jgi:hypothetical protein
MCCTSGRPIMGYSMGCVSSFSSYRALSYRARGQKSHHTSLTPSTSFSVWCKAEGSLHEFHGHVTALTGAAEYRRLSLARILINFLETASDDIYGRLFVDLCGQKLLTKFGFTPFHEIRTWTALPQRHVKHGQDPNKDTSRAQGRCKTGLFAPCVFVQNRKRNTSTKNNFDKAANMRPADIKGKVGKEERGGEPTCAELGDTHRGRGQRGVDRREIAVILLALSVSCDFHCQQGAC